MEGMTANVTKLEENKVRLDVEVPPDAVRKGVEAKVRELGRQVRVPGFRPGKGGRLLYFWPDSTAGESGGMVDTLDLGSSAFGRAGSSPASRTSPLLGGRGTKGLGRWRGIGGYDG